MIWRNEWVIFSPWGKYCTLQWEHLQMGTLLRFPSVSIREMISTWGRSHDNKWYCRQAVRGNRFVKYGVQYFMSGGWKGSQLNSADSAVSLSKVVSIIGVRTGQKGQIRRLKETPCLPPAPNIYFNRNGHLFFSHRRNVYVYVGLTVFRNASLIPTSFSSSNQPTSFS